MYDHFILQIAQTIELTIYLDSNTSKCMLLLKILHNQKKKRVPFSAKQHETPTPVKLVKIIKKQNKTKQ